MIEDKFTIPPPMWSAVGYEFHKPDSDGDMAVRVLAGESELQGWITAEQRRELILFLIDHTPLGEWKPTGLRNTVGPVGIICHKCEAVHDGPDCEDIPDDGDPDRDTSAGLRLMREADLSAMLPDGYTAEVDRSPLLHNRHYDVPADGQLRTFAFGCGNDEPHGPHRYGVPRIQECMGTEPQHKSNYGARLVCADCGKPPDACLCADVAIDDYGATPESWCDCDWLGEGTPRHTPSALCRDMRPEGPRSE